MPDELLIDPSDQEDMLKFLQECGWSKDLTLADILGVEPQRPATAPTTAAISPLH